MKHFLPTLRQALLALTLAATSLAASAGVIPTYHVTVNTAVAAGTSGVLDFQLASLGGQVQASISNLNGAIASFDDGYSSGTWVEVNPLDQYTLLDNAYLSFVVDFGGVFSFDLAFAGDFLTQAGTDISLFTVAALDGVNFLPLGGQDFAATFALNPVSATAGPGVDVSVDGRIAQVQNVPEPSELLLMLTGLAILGALARRRAA